MQPIGYERLSKLDETFLGFETPTTYMHVALTAVFDGGSLTMRNGSVNVGRIREHIMARLHLVPRYRQRLSLVPVFSDAIWIDDDQFDVRYHVRHASLPRPGSDAQLRTRCAEILEKPLDRARPLWQMWIIEGLAHRRFALLTKVHHCVVDGVGGMGILAALFGFAPQDHPDRGQPWRPRSVPEPAQLLRNEMLRRARRIVDLGRSLTETAGGTTDVRGLAERVSGIWSLMSNGLRRPAPLPFNGTVGPYRRIAWNSFPLADVKAAGHSVQATVNDVVLAAVGGALHRYLGRRAPLPPTIKVVVPVNVRNDGDGAEAGNRVSVLMVELPIVAQNDRARLVRVRDITAALRAVNQKAGAVVLTQVAEWTNGHMMHVIARLLSRVSPYNLIVTNVPGPPQPLFLLDAPMVAAYPHLPLFEHQGLGIALLSYAGRLYVGVTGDWDLMPDLDTFATDLGDAFEALRPFDGPVVTPRDDARTGRVGAAPVDDAVGPQSPPAAPDDVLRREAAEAPAACVAL
jgi:WS/DGAT/MGAT family acyltransferase